MTDEQIMEVVLNGGIYDCICDPYDKDGEGDQHSSIKHDLIRFARAILGEYEPVAWMANSEQHFFNQGTSAFVSPCGASPRKDGIVLYRKK